ncbi:molybdenum cofactor guanylyltransferase [Devosia psychrophila]|jgi:molybdopterin-guanine dinucleotide biosynthesis protein A|uniref:Molybdenum cofactor guanylyltransferase n=1 Tax=Devosia psychrophila TaxID=728005 RepID=A0A1I1RIH8_9HYPH|nr:NTP transferase domain-containing protein [Devosia psychrophila]SFD34086.1 molybdopterin-guanine dinucleotide biosynthesis protein A [Devosia psychrophila]
MSLPHAVIIAGGKGDRLGGVRKADLLVGGIRLVDRVAQALGAVQAPVMIAVGPQDDGRRARSDSIAVSDLAAPVGGPLAGLAAAIAALHERGIGAGLLVSVAVDTPFLPEDFVAVLAAALGEASAAYAAWGEQFYPPNSIWQIEALAALPERVLEGQAPHSLKALQRELGAVAVDWSSRAPANPFANVNTVGDLVVLGRMARTRGLSPLIHRPGN